MIVSPYVVRYHTATGEAGSVYVMAKSSADAVAQVKGCSPTLTIEDVDQVIPEGGPTPTELALATALQQAGGLLHRVADRIHGKGLYDLQQLTRARGDEALTTAGQVLSRG